MIVVAALYHFASFPHYKNYRASLYERCLSLRIRGTLLLAEEGVNGTIAGSREAIDEILSVIRAIPGFEGLVHKESLAEKMPFYRMKVRLKKEIVTLGVPGISPVRKVGTYVKPQDWNACIQDPEVLVIDTRNDYEVSMGTFEGAIDPQTKTFREFPKYVEENFDPQKHKKIAMFCTGGIRCEKASSYMLEKGFETVYHLEGGILKYLEEVPEGESLWKGECFVFDERVGVKHGLEVGEYELCRGCRHPLAPDDKLSPKFEEGISCPHCYDQKEEKQRQRATARHRQVLLANSRGHRHIGS